MKLLKLSSFITFLILFSIPLFQLVTGLGIVIGDFMVGLFPGMFLYFLWLLLLVFEIGETGYKKTKTLVTLLFLTLIIVLPFYWFLINKAFHEKEFMMASMPIGGLVFIWLIFCLIKSWNYLSKRIHLINTGQSYVALDKVDFEISKNIFLLFFGGLFTIWWLQPKIVQALNSLGKNKSFRT